MATCIAIAHDQLRAGPTPHDAAAAAGHLGNVLCGRRDAVQRPVLRPLLPPGCARGPRDGLAVKRYLPLEDLFSYIPP